MHTIRKDIGGYDITNLCNQRTRKKQRRCGLSMVRRAVHPNITRNMCGHNFSGVCYFQNCFEQNLSTLVVTLELYTTFTAIQFNIHIAHAYLLFKYNSVIFSIWLEVHLQPAKLDTTLWQFHFIIKLVTPIVNTFKNTVYHMNLVQFYLNHHGKNLITELTDILLLQQLRMLLTKHATVMVWQDYSFIDL